VPKGGPALPPTNTPKMRFAGLCERDRTRHPQPGVTARRGTRRQSAAVVVYERAIRSRPPGTGRRL